MLTTRAARNRTRAGVSLVEVVLVASILTLLARALVESATSMSRVTSTGNVQAVLQEQGEKALSSIISDLRRSGVRTVNGKEFPHVFDDGDAGPGFDLHDHALPLQESEDGDPDFGPMREIVLVTPGDHDGDGRPDMDMDLSGVPELDGDGDGVRSESFADLDGIWDDAANTIGSRTGVVWSHAEVSYVVVTRPDGVNYLERRIDANPATARRVARDVERVQFDTAETSQWDIPLDTVRVQIFFRRRTPEGALFRHRVEVVVSLRNG